MSDMNKARDHSDQFMCNIIVCTRIVKLSLRTKHMNTTIDVSHFMSNSIRLLKDIKNLK